MKNKSVERKLAEKIAKANKCSLVVVNFRAMELVGAGLCASRLEALVYLNSL